MTSIGLMISLGLLCCQTASQPTNEVSTERYKPIVQAAIPTFSYTHYTTKDKFGRTIQFYLSKLSGTKPASQEKLPLVVCIQGSGSQSLFLEMETADGKVIASSGPEAVVARTFRDRVRVLVVEKPGVEFLVQPSQPGSATEGSDEFNREFSLERWAEAINAAVRASIQIPEIDSTHILALGHSEGGQLACELAVLNPGITHVAVMAGGGPTQLFDLIQLARTGDMYDPASTADERVAALMADWQKVMKAPEATDQFILGHSHLRWSSFLKSSPIQAILKTKADVFIAQGTKDTNSLPMSADVLYAELVARGRSCTYERIENGNHAFMLPDDKSGKGWFDTNVKAVNWFLKGK